MDDNIVCTLNGTEVLQVDFGEQGEIELTDMLVQGANKITCTVIDHNNGACYSYDYKIWTSRGGGLDSGRPFLRPQPHAVTPVAPDPVTQCLGKQCG